MLVMVFEQEGLLEMLHCLYGKVILGYKTQPDFQEIFWHSSKCCISRSCMWTVLWNHKLFYYVVVRNGWKICTSNFFFSNTWLGKILCSSLKICICNWNTVNFSGETSERTLLGPSSYWKCNLVWCSAVRCIESCWSWGWSSWCGTYPGTSFLSVCLSVHLSVCVCVCPLALVPILLPTPPNPTDLKMLLLKINSYLPCKWIVICEYHIYCNQIQTSTHLNS